MDACDEPLAPPAAVRAGPPRWLTPLLAAAGIFLVPWAVMLAANLPGRHVAQNWWLAWTGYDLAMAACLILTAIAILRRSPWVQSAAAATAALLFADAWFDILTAHAGTQRLEAVVSAAVAEIPLAIVCLIVAHNAEHVAEQWRRAALAARRRGRRETVS